MDSEELANELVDYLNDTGQYYRFLQWAEDRGFDRDALEKDIDKITQF